MSVLVLSLERAPFMRLLVKDSLQTGAVAPFLGDLVHFISNSNAHPCVLFSSGSGFIMCSGKENPDSDADLDVDGDDTLEYGKPQYRF